VIFGFFPKKENYQFIKNSFLKKKIETQYLQSAEKYCGDQNVMHKDTGMTFQQH